MVYFVIGLYIGIVLGLTLMCLAIVTADKEE